MIERFHKQNYHTLCRRVAQCDTRLQAILLQHGPPPYWVRPNNFATLVLIILEQQVSLAAAFAAFVKLQERIGAVNPQNLLNLSDDELRGCYFTRQKTGYVRGLAEAILRKQINLKAFEKMPDKEVRSTLTQLKGIGNWTVDIYLIHALRRTDVLPLGDLALVKAMKNIKDLPAQATTEILLQLARPWQPYRSIATLILWHHYLQAMRKTPPSTLL